MGVHALDERRRMTAESIVAGMTPHETSEFLRIPYRTVTATVEDLQRLLGVFTLRALSFRLVATGLVPFPGPPARLRLPDLVRHAWAALRWDILDVDLLPMLAARLGAPGAHIQATLDQLCEKHATSLHGLIGVGFAHRVLNGHEPVVPPHAAAVRPAPPGTGQWDASAAQRRVLALVASGRDTVACARAEGTTTSAVVWSIGRCKTMAGVATGRALIDAALRARVLLPPEVTGELKPTGGEQLVLACLPLDVPELLLAVAISDRTGLGVDEVHGFLRQIRIRYPSDEAAVYAAWKLGVITAHTPAPAPPSQDPPPPAAAPVRAALPGRTAGGHAHVPHGDGPALKVSAREHQTLTLLTVDGMSPTEAAARLRVQPSTVRSYEQSMRRRAGVACLRALTHRALWNNLLEPLDAGDRTPGTAAADVLAVWRCLPVDVPDARLVGQITRMTGLRAARVQAHLYQLRATGLSDPQLIAAGWYRRILTSTVATAPAIAQHHPSAAPQFDRLRLLPGTAQEPGTVASPFTGTAVAGQDLDFVRTTAATCRLFLTQVPATRWGPVIGLPEVGDALLLTAAGPRPAQRGPAARIVRPGTRIDLPRPGTQTGTGRYWAIGPNVPLWTPNDLAWLLKDPTPPLPTTSESAP